jgi:hypothetical protein
MWFLFFSSCPQKIFFLTKIILFFSLFWFLEFVGRSQQISRPARRRQDSRWNPGLNERKDKEMMMMMMTIWKFRDSARNSVEKFIWSVQTAFVCVCVCSHRITSRFVFYSCFFFIFYSNLYIECFRCDVTKELEKDNIFSFYVVLLFSLRFFGSFHPIIKKKHQFQKIPPSTENKTKLSINYV